MNRYKYTNHENTAAIDNENNVSFTNKHADLWQGLQDYIIGGGIVDPWKTRDEMEKTALVLLWSHHNQIIESNDQSPKGKKDTRLTKALRKESKGQANQKDLDLLNNNDILDSWFDDMETAAEGTSYGEQWIEDPARTDQELIDYDPLLVPWPAYPL